MRNICLLAGLARLTIVLGLAIAATLSGCLPHDSFEGRCVKVYDGDTIEVMAGGPSSVRVRLHAIDSPEKGQPFSNAARKRTRELVEGKRVRVEVRDRDQYDRLVARVYVEGSDLSEQLISEGLAWHYTRYSSELALGRAQREARKARRGLWQDPDPEPPWEFRRSRREGAGR
ncbi:MAG: thermonuclease family protein [Thermoanaerobaculia bacterium]